MVQINQISTQWRPEKGFWAWHLWLPLFVAFACLYGIEQTSLDVLLADQWFALEGGKWAWRDSWVSYELIHHHGKQLIIAIGLTALSLIVASFLWPRVRYWRMPMSYLLTTMAAVPAAIAYFKHISPMDCPWNLIQYGGDQPYLRNFDHSFVSTHLGNCFPAGHASGGFILLAMYFAALPFVKRPARFLIPGLLVGWVFAIGQQSRGAHFISHDLWTLTICWFGALALFLAFRPATWPRATTVSMPNQNYQPADKDGDRAGRRKPDLDSAVAVNS
jgi:membrane-associated PAP2 superfamily phosphatase